MKILHVVQGYTPAIGGTERLIQLVSEKLVNRHGDDVTVFTTPAYNCELFWRTDQPSLPTGQEVINGVTVRRFPIYNRMNKLRRKLSDFTTKYNLPYNDWFRTLLGGPLVPGLRQAIAESGADVVGASSFPLMHMYDTLKGGRAGGIPVVFHGGIHISDEWGFNRPMIFEAIREVDAYIANSAFEADFLTGRGVSPEKITITGVGVDLEPFEQADGAGLRHRFRMGEAPVVCFVGQQVPHKGIDVVIDAMVHVWKRFPEARLMIAGSRTSYSESLAVKISQLSPDQKLNVVVFDNFKEDEKQSIFAASDLLAFPSCFESFGIVFLEAWASRIPVIGSRFDAITSVIDDGKDGMLVIPNDPQDMARAICELLKDKNKRQAMGEAGRKKVEERYTWNIVAEKFRRVYEQVLQAKKAGV